MSSSLASRERQQDSHDAIHAGQQLFGKEFRSHLKEKESKALLLQRRRARGALPRRGRKRFLFFF
jgi:hypothetical protein